MDRISDNPSPASWAPVQGVRDDLSHQARVDLQSRPKELSVCLRARAKKITMTAQTGWKKQAPNSALASAEHSNYFAVR